MAANTRLVLEGVDLPPYAARGLTQTFQLIDAAFDVQRTINARLVNLSDANFMKLLTTISCEDFQGPAFDPVAPGTLVTVSCAFELSYLTPPEEQGEPPANPPGTAALHEIVTGSLRTRDGFTFYRPKFDGMVMDFHFDYDEFGAAVRWEMTVEEV